MARILQERYFKKGDFLEARLGSKPSFIWRSILWGRKVIKGMRWRIGSIKGMRWRIGSSDKISVHRSHWMPRPQTFKPFSVPTLDIDCKVAGLIDENQQWNEPLIHKHFKPGSIEIKTL